MSSLLPELLMIWHFSLSFFYYLLSPFPLSSRSPVSWVCCDTRVKWVSCPLDSWCKPLYCAKYSVTVCGSLHICAQLHRVRRRELDILRSFALPFPILLHLYLFSKKEGRRSSVLIICSSEISLKDNIVCITLQSCAVFMKIGYIILKI